MIYTVGKKKVYNKYLAEDKNPIKRGRADNYCGGSVWKTVEEARIHVKKNYTVYGVIADWEKDTEPSKEGDWNDLLIDARLVFVDYDKLEWTDWYEKKIEPRIREIVRLLRNNGINTECSCEHDKYVQCQYTHEGFLKDLDFLLCNNNFRNYEMKVSIKRIDGHLVSTMNIIFENLEENKFG